MIPGTEDWEAWGTARNGRATIHCFRKGRVCRWLRVSGVQVCPDQKNVAPAFAWALSEGYRLD